SGALDAPALRLANRLLGNAESAAGIEAPLGGITLRAEASCTVAVTGAAAPITCAGRAADAATPLHLAAGEVLALGTATRGMRCYIGISGGIAEQEVLGSRSRDTLSALGPDELTAGRLLPLGSPGTPSGVDVGVQQAIPAELVLPILLGPRHEWFAAPAEALQRARYVTTEQADRVGIRLHGPRLARIPAAQRRELPSEALITGAVQVPADGLPLIFLADHPSTGGYPVVGVIDPALLPALGQARPGTPLRFRIADQRTQ
ncbi:MAG: biotin-dependent carboxyltransferase family protein, partial [Sciscionella sp.]